MRYTLFPLLWILASPLAAQDTPHACARLAVPAERLACYDRAFPLPADVIEAAATQAQADFGRDRGRDPSSAQAPDRIESRVVQVDQSHNGPRSFILQNGQVWTQTESRSTGHVRAGQDVQVRTGMLGGYQMVTPDGVLLRVRRAR